MPRRSASPRPPARPPATARRRPRVLLTGAAGYVAAQLRPAFARAYDLRLTDARAADGQGRPVPGLVVADLADADRDRYRALFGGVDTVVHLGYRRSGALGHGAPAALEAFEDELANVRMAHHVYRTALEAGVRRVVMASSNHAADWYEHALVHARRKDLVTPGELPLADNFYGWAKASYELLGFVYACGAFGRPLEVVLVRIGAPRDVSGRRYRGVLAEQHCGPGGSRLANFKRDLGAWLSERDLRQLFRRAVDTPDVRNADGVPWQVVYGISDNTRAFWSLESARRVLGYAPQDDSEVVYARDVRRLLTGPARPARAGRLGA